MTHSLLPQRERRPPPPQEGGGVQSPGLELFQFSNQCINQDSGFHINHELEQFYLKEVHLHIIWDLVLM